MAIIIDGKKLAEKILADLKKEIVAKQLKLKLAVVLVGQDPVSAVFVRQKEKACQKIGIGFELFQYFSEISSPKLNEEIKKISRDPGVSGIVVQLPLPENLNVEIPLEKDAEIRSPVVDAVKRILEEYNISLKDKKIVLVGKGKLVGQPLFSWLKQNNMDFFNTDKAEPRRIREADVVISGTGRPGSITGEMVKKGAVIIDVGSSFVNGKTKGDVDFESVSKKAGYITPTPGGVGPMTVACLLKNLVKLRP